MARLDDSQPSGKQPTMVRCDSCDLEQKVVQSLCPTSRYQPWPLPMSGWVSCKLLVNDHGVRVIVMVVHGYEEMIEFKRIMIDNGSCNLMRTKRLIEFKNDSVMKKIYGVTAGSVESLTIFDPPPAPGSRATGGPGPVPLAPGRSTRSSGPRAPRGWS